MSCNRMELIDDPKFEVDFSIYKQKKADPKQSSLFIKVAKLVYVSLQAFAESLWVTTKNLWVSFKITVLGGAVLKDMRLNQGFVLVAFKVCFWVLQVFLTLLVTFIRKTCEKLHAQITDHNMHPLAKFVGPDLNPLHIVTKHVSLDISHLPADLTLDELHEIFDQINFDKPDEPGYMPDSSRKEYTTTYTKQALKESLGVFVRVVKNRTPMLGSPKGHDIQKLLEFYEQIENATKLAIFKSNTQLKEFKEKNGDDISAYVGTARSAYSNLLEDRARIAIDLAIAGKHCAARFMGEAMSVYGSFYSKSESGELNLKETLLEVLAYKRREIALAKIESRGSDTHQYNLYMSKLGKELAIPGTANIHEQLARDLNKSAELNLFFETYNYSTVISTIQEEFKKNQRLRDLFIDWLKESAANWQKEEIKAQIQEKILEVKACLNRDEVKLEIPKSPLEELASLITFIQQNDGELPNTDQDFEDFVAECFATGQGINWFNENHSGKSPIEKARIKNELKRVIFNDFEDELKCEIFKKIKETKSFNPEDFKEYQTQFAKAFEIEAKVSPIKRLLPGIDSDVVMRMVSKETSVETVVEGCLKKSHETEFLSFMPGIDEIKENGLSEALMEWLLVHFEIFKPQE